MKHRIPLLLCVASSLLGQPSHSVELNWDWQSEGGGIATGFNIKRGIVTGGPYTQVGVVSGPAISTFIDFGPFVERQTYYYVVTAAAPTGESSASNEASATIPATFTTKSMGTNVGVFRNGTAFLEDSNGNGAYDAGVDRYIPSFTGPGGFMAGDIPVIGDWTGDGHAKVGIYRSSTGFWYLDSNNNGVYDYGDITYSFGGIPGDVPVVGDWIGYGKSCVGVFRSGFFWILDLNCDGIYEGTPTDAAFPFGGLSGDVPIVGKWQVGQNTRVGVVRRYCPGGVCEGNPFFWIFDNAAANAGNDRTLHQPAPYAFAFGGLDGDQYVTGDWHNIGGASAGVYRSGIWVLDSVTVTDNDQADHNAGLVFGFGGVSTDVPVVGRW